MGWEVKKLSSLCTLFTDGDWIESKNQSSSGIRLIQTGNVGEGVFKNRKKKARYISDETLTKLKCTEIFSGDCLISRLPDPVGRACVLPELKDRAITAVDCTILRFNDDLIINDYFKYYSQSNSYLVDISSRCSGATRKRISRKNLGETLIPVPSLEEQKKIVAILDQAFAEIDKARANAEQNLNNARELFDSYLNQVFSQRGEGWEEKKLGDVCELVGGGTPSKANDEYYGGNIPWATVRDMGKDYLRETEHTITEAGLSNSSTKLIPSNEIVIATRVGLGKVCILGQSTAINQDLKGVIPKSDNVLDRQYLFWWFKSKAKYIESEGTGATVKGVKIPFIKSLSISLPDITKQKYIANNLREASEQVVNLKQTLEQKILNLEELKKSILQKAFSGELT
ncbi:MAG: restriction endonuclease subunit S [Kangiella sp.]|nr:restriction endonuclease subunit S [Kangiella sp.]